MSRPLARKPYRAWAVPAAQVLFADWARIVMPLEDMFRGDRRYEALDSEKHRWHFAERMHQQPRPPLG